MAITLSTLSSSLSTLSLSTPSPKPLFSSPHRSLHFTLKHPTPSLRLLAAEIPAPESAATATEAVTEKGVPPDALKVDLSEYVKSRLPGGFAAQQIIGTGRRKCAIARVVLLEGTGKVIINNRSAREYLQGHPLWLKYVRAPLKVFRYEASVDVFVKAHGGGLAGQAQAICLGVARALLKIDESHRKTLRAHGLLTRDSRVVERKKAGLHKARKAPQYSKR